MSYEQNALTRKTHRKGAPLRQLEALERTEAPGEQRVPKPIRAGCTEEAPASHLVPAAWSQVAEWPHICLHRGGYRECSASVYTSPVFLNVCSNCLWSFECSCKVWGYELSWEERKASRENF